MGLLGDYASHKDSIEATVRARFADLGLQPSDFKIMLGTEVASRERKAPFAAIFFGYAGANLVPHPELDDILSDSVVVLPIVDSLQNYAATVPAQLARINGVERDWNDKGFERDVATILENFRLLRQDRRLFISYKRTDSAPVANQLYAALDARGFDVFLDTHGVPPGRDFQAVLWHRLADSDVVVLLDTPNFFESRWTEQELTRANATSIQILHVCWPGRPTPVASSLSGFMKLTSTSFAGDELGDQARLEVSVIEEISVEVEALRARALGFRHRYLVDAFCDAARSRGLTTNVQPSRHIVLDGREGQIAVVPMVGVPSALRLHDVHRELEPSSTSKGSIWALYDERGLLQETLTHLHWLNDSLPLHAVSVFEVTERLDQEGSQ